MRIKTDILLTYTVINISNKKTRKQEWSFYINYICNSVKSCTTHIICKRKHITHEYIYMYNYIYVAICTYNIRA